MKNDKRLDDAFRKGLPLVETPAAPAQDWAALARSAKQGVRVAAVRDSGSLLNVRWLRLLGGASAILALWYLAFGPDSGKAVPELPATTSGTPAAHAEFLGAGPGKLMELLAVESDGAVTGPATTTAPEGLKANIGDEAVAGMMSGSTERTNGEDHSTCATGSSRRADLYTGHTQGNMAGSATAEQDRSEGHSVDAGATPSLRAIPGTAVDLNVDGPSAAPGRPTSFSALGSERRERIDLLDPLPPAASTLPYQPEDAPVGGTVPEPSFAHWSLAPWFSLSHSTWTDPQNADNGQLDQLTIGHEQPGSIGLRVQYAFDHRFAMITGIQYARKGSLRGTVRTSPFLSTYYTLSGDYLEVPLSLKFTLPLENKDLYVRAGALLQFNKHGGTDKVTVNDASRKEMSTLALAQGSMGTALDIGIGAQFRISRSLGLFIEPSYQYSLSPVVKHPSFDRLPFNPRIHTFSLATGLSFQFP